MISQRIYEVLRDNAGVAAIIAGRVYPVNLKQKTTFPAVTYQRLSGDESETYDGSDAAGNSIYQFDCFADTYAEVNTLSLAVIKAFRDYTDDIIHRTLKQDVTDLSALDGDADNHRISIDFLITHKED